MAGQPHYITPVDADGFTEACDWDDRDLLAINDAPSYQAVAFSTLRRGPLVYAVHDGARVWWFDTVEEAAAKAKLLWNDGDDDDN